MKKSQNRGSLFLGFTIILLSTYEVVSRSLVGRIDPVQVNFIRYFFGGLTLLLPAFMDLRRKQIKLEGRDLGIMLLLGLLLVGVSMSLLQYGINQTHANIAAAVFSSNPLFVAITATLLLNEPLSLRKLLALGIGIIGVVIILLGSNTNGKVYFQGLVYLVFAAFTFGIYTVLGKKITMKVGSLTMNAVTFIFGSLPLIPWLLVKHQPVWAISRDIWPQMFYLAVFVTGLAYYTYFQGLALTDTSLGAMVFFFKPLLAALFAAITLGENLNWGLALGTIVILCSIYLVQHQSPITGLQ